MTKKPEDSTIDITLIIDRSGSMVTMREDAEGGLNTLLADQKAVPGKATLTVATFDDEYEVVNNAQPIDDVASIELNPRGMTALFDAVGKTIANTKARLAKLDTQPDQVLFVITTDGHDNSSKEYTKEQVAKLIKDQDEWQFVFIGANIDAMSAGSGMGIGRGSTIGTSSHDIGTTYSSLSSATASYRSKGVKTMDYADEMSKEDE